MSERAGESLAGIPAAGAPALAHAERPTRRRKRRPQHKLPGERKWLAAIFLAPAVILLGAIVLYPMVYSLIRSFFADGPAGTPGAFVGLDNYGDVFSDSTTLRAVKNNIIWVVVAPTLVTILGLMFAVLTERIRWATVFKTVVFMPMAISMLASGVTFELIYADQPSRGLANAVTVGVHDMFASSSEYPNVHSRGDEIFAGSPADGYTTKKAYPAGAVALLPMTGLNLQSPPSDATQATASPPGDGLHGVVWNDFALGGGGDLDKVDSGELGLPGMTVQAVRDGKVVATTTASADGAFDFPDLTSGDYQLRLPASNFAKPFNGLSWLGPNLITPAIIVSYLWVYAGFAMMLLAAGMSSIPRDVIEAARIDGANEWQVFRRVTAHLLAPVIMVVFVTLVINVLKIFDLVFIIAQGAGANGKYADVLAVSLYNAFGSQKYGLASAIGIILVLLVLPAMVLNVRRFRRDELL